MGSLSAWPPRLYAGVQERRTRNLWKALARVLVEQEVHSSHGQLEVFDPLRSRVAPLVTQFATNPYFVSKLARSIVDPEDEDSLVSIIIKWTVTKDGDGERLRNVKSLGGPPKNAPAFTGVFAANQAEYDDISVSVIVSVTIIISSIAIVIIIILIVIVIVVMFMMIIVVVVVVIISSIIIIIINIIRREPGGVRRDDHAGRDGAGDQKQTKGP